MQLFVSESIYLYSILSVCTIVINATARIFQGTNKLKIPLHFVYSHLQFSVYLGTGKRHPLKDS